MHKGVSVIVPVFHSGATLPELVDRIRSTLANYMRYEIILVDDGSTPDTWFAISELAKSNAHILGVRLGRNYGQHNALVAGVRQARFAICLTLDDDLQNPPEEMPKLIEHLLLNRLDVVYGVPDRPEQHVLRRMAGKLTRYALKSGLGVDQAPAVSSYRAFYSSIREAFSSDIGTNVSLDALLTWGSSRFGTVNVKHDRRLVGKSNYSFRRLLRFAVDTTTGYSATPLQAASIIGFLVAFAGFLSLVWVVGRPLVTGQSVPGFPFLASMIAVFSGVQLATLGVMGEYLARMHFRIMRKPTYLIVEMTEELGEVPGN